MSVRPTRRLAGVIVAAALIYLAAANSLLVWLYAVTAMLIALLPLGIAGPWLSVRRAARIHVTSMRSSGFEAPLAQDAGRVFVHDALEISLLAPIDPERVVIGPLHTTMGVVLPVTTVRVDEQTGAVVVGTDLGGRGQIDFAHIDLTSTWPFGIVEARRRMQLNAAVLVHPRYAIVPARRGAGAGVGGEDPTRKGAAEDVVGLREYRSGDSRRQVHWLTTARMGKLMVVERAAPTFAALRARLRLETEATPAAVELAVYVTATLAASCEKAGRPFRLSLPDGPPEARHWNEAIARLARSKQQPSPRGQAVNAAIRADALGVLVESETGSMRLPPDADEAAVAAAVVTLL